MTEVKVFFCGKGRNPVEWVKKMEMGKLLELYVPLCRQEVMGLMRYIGLRNMASSSLVSLLNRNIMPTTYVIQNFLVAH